MISLRITSILLIVIVSSTSLSGCLPREKAAEKLYSVLESVAGNEKGFEQVQDPLVQKEKKEKTLYDKIVELNTNQYNDKVKISDEALTMVNDRKKYMETETNSLQQSEKEFKKAELLINKMDDNKLKNEANQLYDLMISRYKAHQALSKEYLTGVSEDQKLYTMFKNKNASIENLEGQIEKLNSIYKNIYSANDQFNQLTQQYNAKKLKFYKDAGLIKE
ncbi:MAG: YkyA family protein [Bacillota bacterium]|nr:YkyA family protein [Bacillota bacterium]MDP4154469.1 YkyA family protein [Bacillota bacterium]